MNRVWMSLSVGFCVGLLPIVAQAEDKPAAVDTTADIVVTANKRVESANKVGLTITALSGATLQERQITSLADIAAAVPGLSYTPSTTNTPIYTLRGVGFNESSLGVYPAVSVYMDQAPLPFPVMASHSAYDLERLEVLKGPQGTLFGQNATGGAINYIAAKPTNYLTAGGDIAVGRFGSIDGNAFISGPIAQNLTARLAMTAHHMNDWQYSSTRDDTNGHQDYVAGRLLLDWKASESLRFSLNLNAWRDKSQPQAAQLAALRPTKPTYARANYINEPFVTGNAREADWTHFAVDPYAGAQGSPVPATINLDPMSDRKFFQAALRADLDVASNVTLTSITTYDRFRQEQRTDGDGVAAVGFDLQKDHGELNTFSQELRLANTGISRFRWIVGGNFERSTTLENQWLRYYDNSTSNPTLLNINFSGDLETQKITNLAAFGNAEYELTDKLTAKGGVRYTDSKTTAYNCGYTDNNGYVDILFNFLGSLNLNGLNPAPTFAPIGPGGCYTLNNQGVPGEPFQDTLHEHNVSWRAGLDYKLDPHTLVYANISRGYKAGSFPALAAAGYVGLAPVKQESVTAFEAGVKAQMFDRRIQLNAAGFYYDYKNKQIRGKLLDPIFGVLDVLINIPKSSIYGAEADVTIRAAEGLTLAGSVTYLHSAVKQNPAFPRNFDILGNQRDFIGTALPYTPQWSGTVSADYRFKLGSGTPFMGAEMHFQAGEDAALAGGSIIWPTDPAVFAAHAPGLPYVYRIPSYATVGAHIGYEAADGAWRVMLWGKNLTNKYYITSVIPASDSTSRLAGLPVTYGITFGFKYK